MISPHFHSYLIYIFFLRLSELLLMKYISILFTQALRYLGFNPTVEQQQELRQRLPADHAGFVSYGGKVSKKEIVYDFSNKSVCFLVHHLAFSFLICMAKLC